LMQLDTPLHLYNDPANKFVAGFIGSPAMNFLKGTIQDQNGYYFIHESANCRIFLGDDIPAKVKNHVGRSVQLGVRPEHIFICEENDNTEPDCKLEVIAYENMGNEQLIYFSLAKQTLIVRRPPIQTIDAGKEKGIRFDKGKIIYFDELTGEVI
jgi:multiple sugar transport system ATP-binding protein